MSLQEQLESLQEDHYDAYEIQDWQSCEILSIEIRELEEKLKNESNN